MTSVKRSNSVFTTARDRLVAHHCLTLDVQVDISRNRPTLFVGFGKYLLTNVRCYEVLSKRFATF